MIGINDYRSLGNQTVALTKDRILWLPFYMPSGGTLTDVWAIFTGVPASPIEWRLYNQVPASTAQIPSLPVVASGSITVPAANQYMKLNTTSLNLTVTEWSAWAIAFANLVGGTLTVPFSTYGAYKNRLGLPPIGSMGYQSNDSGSTYARIAFAPFHSIPIQLRMLDASGSEFWIAGGWHHTAPTSLSLAGANMLAVSFRLPRRTLVKGVALAVGVSAVAGSILNASFRTLQTNSFLPASTIISQVAISGLMIDGAGVTNTYDLVIPLTGAPQLLSEFAVVLSAQAGSISMQVEAAGGSTNFPVSRYNNVVRLATSTNGGATWTLTDTAPLASILTDSIPFNRTLPPGFQYIY